MSRPSARLVGAALAAVVLTFAAAMPAFSETIIYNFSADVGFSTTFSNTINGVTATFSSPSDPGGFGVSPTFFGPPMNGTVLLDPGSSGADDIPLDISFSQDISYIALFFATDGTGPFDLSAYENGALVGTVSQAGAIPNGYSFPQGYIKFSGVFNSVVLTSPRTPYFAVDNVGIIPSSGGPTPSVPEPSSLLLLGSGALGLAGFFRRKLFRD